MKFLSISEEQLKHEWKHECLNSLFFSYHPTPKENEEILEIFLKHFSKFSYNINIRDEHIEYFKNQLYKGNSFFELEQNTSYMKKNIPLILEQINSNKMYTPLILFKNNNYEILSGRTRISIMHNILHEDFNATIIDYSKMMEILYPYKQRVEQFISDGSGILCLENKTFRKRLLFYLRNNDLENCINLSGEVWNDIDEKYKLEIIEDIKKELGLNTQNLIQKTLEEPICNAYSDFSQCEKNI